MRQIREEAGCLVILSSLRVLSNRLLARPDTRSLAAPVSAAREALSAAHARWQELYDLRLTASGTVAFADDEEDALVARLVRRLLVLVDGKRGDARFQLLFDEAPSKTTYGVANGDQARLVEHLIETIAEDGAYEGLRDLLPSLTAARKSVVDARSAQQEALQEEEGAWKAVQVAEQKAREVYRDTAPQLEILFPGRKGLVDSFYPATKKSKAASGSAPKGTPEASAPR